MTEEEFEGLDLIGTGEASRLVKRDPHTVRVWIREGKIRAWRLSGRWLVSKTELLEQFQLREYTPPTNNYKGGKQ